MALGSAKLVGNVTIQWTDTTPFNGRVVAVLALPTGFTAAYLLDVTPPQRIGTRAECPIVNGVPDAAFNLTFNSSLTPSGTRWAFYWLDVNGTVLYTPTNPGSELYNVTASPFTLPMVALVKPSAANLIPSL